MTDRIKRLAEEIGPALKARQLMLATAESCTGGGLSYWITHVAGSSNWFERGFVTYSNAAKVDLLGVHPDTLAKYGAVSEETAREMAEGAIRHSQAQVSIAVTGIAGPDGGSLDKPVGTVWLAWVLPNQPTQTECLHLTGDRETIRLQTIEHAFAKLITLLLTVP